MKTFYWKEWREGRLGILWAPLLTLVLLAMASVYNLDALQHRQNMDLVDAGATEGLILILWFFSAILCGASMMAPEIGSGSLQFLSSLPISRRRIWWTKIVVGLVTLALCIVGTALAYYVGYSIAFHVGAFDRPINRIVLDFLSTAPWQLPLIILPLFSLGALVTMLVDRTITALVGTIITAAVFGSLIIYFISQFGNAVGNSGNIILQGMLTLTVPFFLSISYRTFMRGETLKTSNRFKVAIPGFLADVVIVFAALLISVIWILHG
jgi:ABC-type transport system involved in multi-copper enzyme maturation permease subunit